MAHDLAKIWKSRIAEIDDPDGVEFDLSNLSPGGDAGRCSHGNAGGVGHRPISGQTDPLSISEAPAAKFQVRINQRISDFVRVQYRGIAILNPATNQINKIVGTKRTVRFPFLPAEASEVAEEAQALVTQEEGTWVATQP
jgi:hypothetical protein